MKWLETKAGWRSDTQRTPSRGKANPLPDLSRFTVEFGYGNRMALTGGSYDDGTAGIPMGGKGGCFCLVDNDTHHCTFHATAHAARQYAEIILAGG